jgi:hypothetical protein
MRSGYDVALNQKAWEIVGRPKQGEEFTFAGRTWRFGDKVPELYKDARFDIFDKGNQIFSGGQLGRADGAGGATKKAGRFDWQALTPLSDDEEASVLGPAAKQRAADEQGVISRLIEKYKDAPNLGTIYKDIDNNSDIAPELRNRFKEKIQDEMTQSMIEYDPDLQKLAQTDPDKAKMLAWSKWHNSKGEIVATNYWSMNPGEGINADSLKDLWSKVVGAHTAFTNTLQNPILAEQQVLNRFYKAISTKPGAFQAGEMSEQDKKDLLDKIHNTDPKDRYDLINKMLPQDTGVQNVPYASEVVRA